MKNKEIKKIIKKSGVWGGHPKFKRSDWQHEVVSGDTNLGYWEWVWHQIEGDEDVPNPDNQFVKCSLCKNPAKAKTAHLHQGEYIGDECCWDERLRASE